MNKVIKNSIIIITVVILAMIIYMVLNKNNGNTFGNGLTNIESTNVTDSTVAVDAQAASQQLLLQLLAINSINIDDKLTTNPAFNVLQDFVKPITPDNNPGRSNPFAPLGQDVAAVSTQVTTGNISSITGFSALFTGSVALGGKNITRWFEYGLTNDLGTKTQVRVQLASGNFTELISGLTPSTTYYVKAFASLGGQVVSGGLLNFTTAAK